MTAQIIVQQMLEDQDDVGDRLDYINSTKDYWKELATEAGFKLYTGTAYITAVLPVRLFQRTFYFSLGDYTDRPGISLSLWSRFHPSGAYHMLSDWEGSVTMPMAAFREIWKAVQRECRQVEDKKVADVREAAYRLMQRLDKQLSTY